MPATNARPIDEPQWPAGGFRLTKAMAERNYTVNQFTGQPTSNVLPGQWERGSIVRQYQPNMHPPMLGYWMYDPTDPATWHQPQH